MHCPAVLHRTPRSRAGNNYVVERGLGKGTYGHVYAARADGGAGQLVAIKNFKRGHGLKLKRFLAVARSGVYSDGKMCVRARCMRLAFRLWTREKPRWALVMDVVEPLAWETFDVKAAAVAVCMPKLLRSRGLVMPDISPCNMGRTRTGNVVLIDPDAITTTAHGDLIGQSAPWYWSRWPTEPEHWSDRADVQEVLCLPGAQIALTRWAGLDTALALASDDPKITNRLVGEWLHVENWNDRAARVQKLEETLRGAGHVAAAATAMMELEYLDRGWSKIDWGPIDRLPLRKPSPRARR